MGKGTGYNYDDHRNSVALDFSSHSTLRYKDPQPLVFKGKFGQIETCEIKMTLTQNTLIEEYGRQNKYAVV